MRKTILTALGAALIAVSMAQTASAAERHHARKVEQFPQRQQRRCRRAAEASGKPTRRPPGWSAPAGPLNGNQKTRSPG